MVKGLMMYNAGPANTLFANSAVIKVIFKKIFIQNFVKRLLTKGNVLHCHRSPIIC